MTPNNPYSLSKSFGEQICDAAVRRTAGRNGSFLTLPPPPESFFLAFFEAIYGKCEKLDSTKTR
jgi:hypothetical protein